MGEEKIRFWFENPSYASGVSQLPVSGVAVLSGTQLFIGSVVQTINGSTDRIALVRVDTNDRYQTDVQLFSCVSYGVGEWRDKLPLQSGQHHPEVCCVSGTYSTIVDAPGMFSGSFFYRKAI